MRKEGIGGYIGRLARINLSKEEIKTEELSRELIMKFLGGNGFGAYILYKELSPRIDPFSPENKIVIATGPATGTIVPASNKIGVFSKSPLTGLFFDSYASGHFGPELKFAGYDAIIIEGKARRPVYLWIQDGIIEVRDATHIWGKDTIEAQRVVKKEVGDSEAKIATIGPAGENLVRFANIAFGLRFAGRGGLGAVMGSKNLKAIAVRGEKHEIAIAQPEKLHKYVDELLEEIKNSPLTKRFRIFGTWAALDANNAIGLLGVRNWQEECWEGIEKKIGSTAFREKYAIRDVSCYACPIRCTKFCKVGEGGHEIIVRGPEYETLYALGTMWGVDNPEYVIKAAELCDRYGLDTISTGVVIAFAMELFERGIITKKDTDDLELRFGNYEAGIQLIKSIAYRRGFGAILAEGSRRAADMIGRGADYYACLLYTSPSPRD